MSLVCVLPPAKRGNLFRSPRPDGLAMTARTSHCEAACGSRNNLAIAQGSHCERSEAILH
jgi:hypothetical protein